MTHSIVHNKKVKPSRPPNSRHRMGWEAARRCKRTREQIIYACCETKMTSIWMIALFTYKWIKVLRSFVFVFNWQMPTMWQNLFRIQFAALCCFDTFARHTNASYVIAGTFFLRIEWSSKDISFELGGFIELSRNRQGFFLLYSLSIMSTWALFSETVSIMCVNFTLYSFSHQHHLG